MIKAIDANMYLYLFVENIAPIQEIDTANCIHFKLNSVVLNIHIDKKDRYLYTLMYQTENRMSYLQR